MKTILLSVVTLAIAAGAAFAAIYSYKCPKCGLIQQYSMPGVYKCPNDAWLLQPAQ